MLFIKANNLSGAFLWSIDLDDFKGDYCNQGPYPLLSTISSELKEYKESDFLNSSVKVIKLELYTFYLFIFLKTTQLI